MPGYKATVVGENFEFLVDGETQYLDFYRTIYVDAADEGAAQESALELIREELARQSLLPEGSKSSSINVEFIGQAEVLEYSADEDFIWYFPDEADEDWDD